MCVCVCDGEYKCKREEGLKGRKHKNAEATDLGVLLVVQNVFKHFRRGNTHGEFDSTLTLTHPFKRSPGELDSAKRTTNTHEFVSVHLLFPRGLLVAVILAVVKLDVNTTCKKKE